MDIPEPNNQNPNFTQTPPIPSVVPSENQPNLSSVSPLPVKSSLWNKIPLIFKIGIVVFVVISAIIIFNFIIIVLTGGLNNATVSVTLTGASNPTLVQVQSYLKESYPTAKINMISNNTKSIKTGETQSMLLIDYTDKEQLSQESIKQIATRICNIYSDHNQQIELLGIASSTPRLFGIFNTSPMDENSLGAKSCPDWINKPAGFMKSTDN